MRSINLRLIAAAIPILACATDAGAQAKVIDYKYDALGRLTYVHDSQNGNRDYDYDRAGNRLKVAVGTTSDAASEPASANPEYIPGADPIPRNIPPKPTSQFKNYVADCAWRATWKLSPGATYYSYRSLAGRTTTIYPVDSSGDTSVQIVGAKIYVTTSCPVGNPQASEPGSVKACNLDGCSDPASF